MTAWISLARLAAAVLLAAAAVAASNAMADAGERAQPASAGPARPGDLVEKIPFPEIDPSIRDAGAQAARVRYWSTSAWGGKSVVVSAAVFLPGGKPPAGGWPVIALAHGTTGIRTECGPSLSSSLFGAAPMIAGLLKQGFAVAAADYEGLGEPGMHAYLNSRAAGFNVIDSVRALRQAWPDAVSDRWAGVGGSQGGGAIWAANEQAASRAPELHLVGVVALVPAARFAAYADLAAEGKLGPDQRAAYIWMLMSLSRGHPDLNIDLYRHGSAARNWDTLSYCFGPHAEERNDALALVTADELKPATPAATNRMRSLLEDMALPQHRATAPMLVVYAGRDTFLDPAWTREAIAESCKRGSQIEAVYEAQADHGTANIALAVPWLAQRFAGTPVTGACKGS